VQHGRPLESPDENEPKRLAQAVAELDLSHVVVTSVTRDDLSDGGAAHYALVVRALRHDCSEVKVELLVPDFKGSEIALATALAAWPDILAHNIETVPRLYPQVRRGADYARSLALLRRSRIMSPGTIIKSSLMLGLGEEDAEVQSVLSDLAATGCDMLTIGQYLAPSLAHAQVVRYVLPREFDNWRERALQMGFRSVAAGPLIRSSYKAPALLEELR
jgi:lipoic acid synthetase